MAPARATNSSTAAARRAASARGGSSRSRRASSRASSDDLETQVAQLQSDLKSITQTLQRMGEDKMGEVRSGAKQRVAELKDKGEELLDTAQDEFGAFEKQIKDTIREKPLTAVAGAMALGFLLAVITR
jgi:ElaB/YqjD/DUF883 family membrane-anchored ribosome-binding protein